MFSLISGGLRFSNSLGGEQFRLDGCRPRPHGGSSDDRDISLRPAGAPGMVILSFIRSFNTYLLSAYHVPSAVHAAC